MAQPSNGQPHAPDVAAAAGARSMAELVAALDWSSTPLGPTSGWPEALRVAVDICLSSRFPMFVWWGPQLINIYNDGYVPMLGKRHPAALGRPARDSWNDIWDVVGAQADLVMNRGQATWNERVKLVMERNGYSEDTYFTWSYSPIRDADGTVAGLFCAVTEETERVRAEDALRASEARLRALVNASSDVVYRMSSDWVEMHPVDGRDLVASNLEPISDWMERNIPATEHARVREAIARAVATKGTFELEHRVIRPDGSQGWTSSRAVPLLSDGGEIVEWFGAASDATDRHAAEDALRGSEQRYERQTRLFERIASTTPDFIYVFDLDGRFVYANRRLLEVWGRTFEQAVGRSLSELGYPQWHADMHMREIAQVIATKQPIKGEVPFTGGSGISGVYEYIFTPVLGDDGNVELIAGTTRDVTDRRRTEARDRFLLALDEAVRPLTDPEQITAVHARLLGEYLEVDRCAYADVEADQDTFNLTGDYTRGDVQSIVGRYRFIEFGEEVLRLMRADEPFVVHDVDAHQPPLGDLSAYRMTKIQAVICVPLHKAGQFVAAMAVHQKIPRRWTTAEVELVRAVAARCWESIERGRVVRALRRSEERYRSLFELIDEGLCVIDMLFDEAGRPVDYVFVEVNPGFEKQTGISSAVGRRMREIVPGHEQHWFEAYGRVALTGEPVRFEAPASALGGRVYDVYAFRVGAPEQRRVAVLFRDVGERSRAQEQLRRAHDTFYHLIQNNPFGVYVVDADFRLAQVSLGAQKVFEHVRPLLGRDFADVLRAIWEEPFASDAIALFRRTLETGEPYKALGTIERREDTSEVEAYDWRIERITLPDGRYGVVCYFYDLSERQRFEAQLRAQGEELARAKEAAERASEAKSEFLATLSHELRTPLTPVLLTVSLIESHPELPEELRQDVATIRRNVELESRLISDLLDLTRIANNKLQMDPQDVDLHLIVRSAVDICQREAAARLSVDLSAVGHAVRGDSTRLQQIFWNLVNNAIKFTPPGGLITVRSSNPRDGRVRVEVSDTGAGIDAAVLPKLFSAFEQGEVRSVRQQAGLGLGLAISKRLAEAHGGTITAASAGRGKGSTFTVDLPTIDQPAAVQDARVGPAGPARASASRPLKVLLVEDHEPTLRVLERLLREIGHSVTGVSTVVSALAAVRAGGYDLLISDLGLPDGSGLDIMRRVRDRYAGRAIALTGYGMEGDIIASRDAGFTEHLIKPVDLPTLDDAIRRTVERAALSQQH